MDLDTDQFRGKIFQKDLANGDPVVVATDNGMVHIGTGYNSSSRILHNLQLVLKGGTTELELDERERNLLRESKTLHVFNGPSAILSKKYEVIDKDE